MELRGIKFGPCLDAAGTRGWFGEGYWFHQLLPFYDFTGSTRVAKTTTLNPNKGNMGIKNRDENYSPKKLFPDCIWWSWRRNIALNSVGLSGPGATELIGCGLLGNGKNDQPFMISFMSVAKTPEERVAEFRAFVRLLRQYPISLSELRIGLQINLSCPNTGLDPAELIHEGLEMLEIARVLNIPILIKLNVLAPHDVAAEIAARDGCDALCISNTIPFGAMPEHIPWNTLFPNGSPIAKYGGGGLSGTILLPIVAEWIREARREGIDIPINAGGGITQARDVDFLVEAGLRRGVDSIFIGSIVILRPWNIGGVIRRSHDLLGIA